MKALSELDYDELHARAVEAARLPALDGDDGDYAGLDVLDNDSGSGYGQIAVTSDVWLRSHANVFLAGLPDAPTALDALRRLDEDTLELVLLTALHEIDLEQGHLRAFDPGKHKRWPKGHPLAGKFRPMVDLLKAAILDFDPKKDKHPFELFTRPQLLKVAKERGITLKRGEDRDSIADKLLKDLGGPAGTPEGKPAAKTDPAKPVKAAADVQAGDFSGLKRVGGQAGTAPGGVFEAADGSRWYVKAQKSEAHAENEATAAALYREAGVDVPAVHRGSGLAELGDGPQTATRIIDGAKPDLAAKLGDPDYVAAVRAGFAVDAWLGNWDVVGMSMDNIVTADGKPHRVDVGGSLLFRAQGAPKGDAFGKSVVEWATLRDSDRAPQASRFFADITPEQLQESAKLVANIKPAKIRKLVGDPGLAQLLIDRRTDLLARAKKVKAPDFEARAAKAATAEKALEAAPLQSSGNKIKGNVPAGWTNAQYESSAEALDDYRGIDYVGINGGLRSGNVDSFAQQRIDGIDRAMAASRLKQDVLVYRGIRSPHKVFGNSWLDSSSKAGLTWTDNGYTSTTVDKRVTTEAGFTDEHDSALMRIVVPRGVSAVRLSDMAPAGTAALSSISHEAELLLDRGLTFRVVADHGYDGTTKRRLLDVEVVLA